MVVDGYTYQLSFTDDPHWMIGSSTMSVYDRKRLYWKNATVRNHPSRVFQLIRQHGNDGFRIDIIDEHIVDSKDQLRRQEQILLDTFKNDLCLNERRAATTKEEKWAYTKLQRNTQEGKLKKRAANKRWMDKKKLQAHPAPCP